MPYLVIKDAELLKVLIKHYNFQIIRQKGSHLRLGDGRHRVTIPMHNRELKQGTLNHILKQAGLEKDDLIKYL